MREKVEAREIKTEVVLSFLMVESRLNTSVQGNARAKKGEWVGRGLGVGGYGGLLV